MPKWIEQVLIAGAIGLFLAITVGIFLRALFEIVVIFDLAGGDLTWGDIFTLMSIIVAGIIAGIGWFLTIQHRQNEIERLAQVERAEAERMALADAVVMYKRLHPIHMAVISLIASLVLPSRSNLVAFFPETTGRGEAENNNKILVFFLNVFNEFIPDTDEYFRNLHSLYVHKQDLGDKYVNVLMGIRILKMDVDYYLDHPIEVNVNRFCALPNSQKKNFFKLIIHALNFLIAMEACRENIRGARFTFSYVGTEMIELRSRLNELQGIDVDAENTQVQLDQESFLQMLRGGRDYFESRRDEFAKLVASGSK